MRELPGFFIDGAFVPSRGEQSRDMVSPSTGEVYGRIPVATKEDIDAAVRAARAAFDDGRWSGLSVADRVAVLDRAADVLAAHVDEIAEIQAAEVGTPVMPGRLIVQEAIEGIRRAGRVALTAPGEEHRSGAWDYVLRHEPVGVVGTIAPWNGAMFLTATKAATAMAAGCTVVDKPAVEAPFSPMFIAEAFADAGLPPGVFNLLPADREVGEELVRHPMVDKISFTGSTAAGRRIAATCGESLKGTILELGGKSAAIVLEDADLTALAGAIAAGCFFQSGQVCVALSRVLAPRSRYQEVVDTLVAEAERWRPGDPFDDKCVLGPLASERQRDRVESYVEIGKAEGAVVAAGGGRTPGAGFYFEPTVFRDVDNTMRIAQEEIFGPVVSVIAYDTVEEAVAMANDSDYGLHGAVFTADQDRALEIAARIRTGTFTVNGFTMNFDAPLGGIKASGIGTMNAVEGFNEYRVLKTVNLRPTAQEFDTNLVG